MLPLVFGPELNNPARSTGWTCNEPIRASLVIEAVRCNIGDSKDITIACIRPNNDRSPEVGNFLPVRDELSERKGKTVFSGKVWAISDWMRNDFWVESWRFRIPAMRADQFGKFNFHSDFGCYGRADIMYHNLTIDEAIDLDGERFRRKFNHEMSAVSLFLIVQLSRHRLPLFLGIMLSGSFQWPCTQDENLHHSPRALLPVRAGRHIGNADQSAK